MSDFINRTDLTQYVRSGNDPDYIDPPWLLVLPGSANATLIASVPGKYRKISGDVLSEMDAGEKAAVDAAEAAATLASHRAASIANVDVNAPEGFDLRALIETFNKRDNWVINRLLELQAALDAVKASTGPADNIRAAIPATWLATATRSKPDTVQEYKDNITAGAADPP